MVTVIDRRTFIKCLLSSTVVSLLTTDIAQADALLRDTPLLFNVSDGGQLSFANYLSPPDRYEAYQYGRSDIETKNKLLDVCIQIDFLRWEIYDLACYKFADLEPGGDEYEEIEKFILGLDDRQFEFVRQHVDEWFSDDFDDANDYELEAYNGDIVNPLNGFDAAYRLFAGYSSGEVQLPESVNEGEIEELFQVKVIEGEYPGSSYYAAELGITVEEANRRAEAMDMPVRFQQA